MTIDEMDKSRRKEGYTYKQISDGSGVALGTVQKIFGGSTSSPRYDTIQKLEGFFVREASHYMQQKSYESYVGAESDQYSRKKIPGQGEYTLDDYLEWPEEERIELIDGVIYDMAAPRHPHQVVAMEIFAQVRGQIRDNKGKCVPLMAPVDVQLNKDNKTIVQPDFMIVCDRSKLENKKRVYGTPDFVVEVLSPSTRIKDVFIKQNKYYDAGVMEYWTVDLKERKVTVYLFKEGSVNQYGFDEVVPISMYDGKVKVDFKDITEYAESIFGEDIS